MTQATRQTHLFYDIAALSPTQLRGLSGLSRDEDVCAYVVEWVAFEIGCHQMDAPSADWMESHDRFESAREEHA